MTGTNLTPSVPKGPATITGYGASLVGFVGLVLALIFPDGDEQTLAAIAAGVVALVPLVVTNIGRMLQAREAIRQQGALVYAQQDRYELRDQYELLDGLRGRVEALEAKKTRRTT